MVYRRVQDNVLSRNTSVRFAWNKTWTSLMGLLLLSGALTVVMTLAPTSKAYALSGLPAGCEYPPQDEPDSDGDECYAVPDTAKSQGQNCDGSTNSPSSQAGQTCGDPINDTTGNVYESQTDYRGAGIFPLDIVRSYNSQSTTSGVFGANWSFSFDASIRQLSATSVQVIRPDHKALNFALINGKWQPDADVNGALVQIASGWRYTNGTDAIETYDASGKLLTITERGLTQTLGYDDQGRLSSVTGPFGRTVSLSYDASNRIVSMLDPAGHQYSYGYDANNNLVSVTYPDGTSRSYLYENSAYPHALTGLIDENGVRYASWAYDSSGRAISSQRPGGVEKVSLSYDFTNGITYVTDALGHKQSYSYLTGYGVAHTLHATKPAASGYGNATNSWFYDGNGNISAYLDYLNRYTFYSYDKTRNLETSRTEAAGTAQARTISTQWNPDFRLPAKITEPGRQTTFSYDSVGHLIQKTVTDTASGASRTWSYTYNSQGLLATADGPRTDVQDITTFQYDAQGNLASITDALGHTTTISAYDPDGRPLTITDPNGLTTQLAYDARGRLTRMAVGTEVTLYSYDNAGQLTHVALPDGNSLTLAYDDAHRLTEMSDGQGNRVVYTLDAVDNRVKANTYDPQGTLALTRSQAFDQVNHLVKVIGAQGQMTNFSYDNEDNRIGATDPLSHPYQIAYDALNRPIQQTNPLKGSTRYTYDSLDHLTSATDPNGHTTKYSYNALGDRLSQTSPDTGTTTFTYDNAGNVIGRTDAKGQATTYTYDALNRITQQVNADGTVATWDYDTAVNGIGRLTVSSNPSGTTSYTYDSHGRITTRVESIANSSQITLLTTGYSYNANGQLQQMTYPSGKKVGYQYDSNGKLIGLALNGKTLLSNITWSPFGPVSGWTWSNGATYQRTFDQDGRITSFTMDTDNKTVGYDADGNITALGSALYSYDAINRLIGANDAAFTLYWSYDANGNRTSQGSGWLETAYTIDSTSNKLLAVGTTTYQYDANGSLIADGTNTYQYDTQGRLINVNDGTTAQYRYNAEGQRVYKWTNLNTTDTNGDGVINTTDLHNVINGATTTPCTTQSGKEKNPVACVANQIGIYANNGQSAISQAKLLAVNPARLFAYDGTHMLGEYGATGVAVQETIWLGNLPVATLQNGAVYNIYPDQLGTPRVITDAANTEVWKWDSDPFGTAPANEDPSGSGSKFTYNLRFPGQYFDSETGKHYNYFRDYDPSVGRYVESDPIGLAGGMNTYGYAGVNPLERLDKSGQFAIGAVVGAIVGGYSGAMGAVAQNGSWGEILTGTLAGAVLGGAIGLVDPSEGVGTMALIGAGAGLVGDISGQGIHQILQVANGEAVSNWDVASTVGATVGGALGGALSAAASLSIRAAAEVGAEELAPGFESFANNSAFREWIENIGGGFAGLFPNGLGGVIGSSMWAQWTQSINCGK